MRRRPSHTAVAANSSDGSGSGRHRPVVGSRAAVQCRYATPAIDGPFSRVSVPRTTTSRPVHWETIETNGWGTGDSVRHRPVSGSKLPAALAALNRIHSRPVQTELVI